MKRAAIYARVSTDEQAEHGYSLQSQLDACDHYAESHELSVVEQVTDGFSGAKLDRPGLDRIRELIDANAVDAVIVFSPDLLTRNLAHSLL